MSLIRTFIKSCISCYFFEGCCFKNWGALLLCPCFFCPSDNVWRSWRDDAPRCAHFSAVFSSSWITEQILVGKCTHRGESARWERQTSFKIVTWTKQTWTKHQNTELGNLQWFDNELHGVWWAPELKLKLKLKNSTVFDTPQSCNSAVYHKQGNSLTNHRRRPQLLKQQSFTKQTRGANY